MHTHALSHRLIVLTHYHPLRFCVARFPCCPCPQPPPKPQRLTQKNQQAWLLVGVILILGSGYNYAIPLIVSLAFTAAVLIIPAIYEFVLSPAQRDAISAKLSRGKSTKNGWEAKHLPDAKAGDVVAARDTLSKDVTDVPGGGKF